MSTRKSSNSGQTPDKRSRLSQPEPSEENEMGYFSSEDVTGEVGIIESISLRNFMCHSMLGPFKFGPNVNFVVGNNGSGKSAVLTALIVALGGKAHTTNRGSSLKGFVKEGESSADVSITLRNRGRDAYKPEVFGQSIIVDLRISSEGMRTYKLRSKTGRLVSSKKEELISILDHFNIQVDNPVSILTQEMSKHFLHSKGEGDKYKFFMKATQLDQMKEDYSYIMKTKTMTQNTVEKHRETLQELKKKYHEKEERYKSLASLDEMQKKLDELKNQMAWALVAEVEQEIKPMRERITAEEKSTVKYDQKVDEWEGKVQEANRILGQLQDQLEGVTQRMQQLQPQCVELKSRAQACNQDLKAAEAGLHCKKTNLRDLEKDKDQLNKRIRELKHSISQTKSADTHARVEKLNHIQAELEQILAKDRQGEMRAYEEHKKAQESCRKLQAELTELQNVEEPHSEDLKPLEEDLEELSSRISACREEFEAARNQVLTHKREYEEAEQLSRQQREAFNSIAEEAEPIKEQLSNSDQELERSKHHKKHYEEKRKAHLDMIETLKKNLNEKDQLLQASIAKASETCPERLDVRRTAKSLDSEISRLRHKINTQQDQQGHRDTIIRQFHEAKENFNNIARQVKGLEAIIRQLTEIINTRHNVYAELREYLSVRCMYYFDSMLSQRGYIGKMTFDHKNETLSISVQPGEGGKAALSDMRSLSGGERSFSTVCFVLSLWAIAEAPFRALDEFDVYMDMVNRRISMDMMLKIAASQRYRQFIFLTPQSMSSLPVNNSLIRIHRLNDPDRSQST
ncbi:structural maintenance of chromosomes protein 6-like [Sinocyclocheilus grahami]|uniref:structural maintenance of chromosomes protein 6-like n=1 Tax=Sinocyclocheilus grahami TaxID=75366 RepID=UPI0007AD2D1A|nr:PREDICTED: structural maintenance of chromosomes protein 6-like [Sinocyclocheilus grahami]